MCATPTASAPTLPHPPLHDRELARLIDHTLLRPDASREQVVRLCQEALDYGFATVCVAPTWVATAAELLAGSDVKVCAVIGFPLGSSTTHTKQAEAAEAVRRGATELDMVINIGALKSGQAAGVLADIQAVVEQVRGRALVKVILETGLLSDAEKVLACRLARDGGADFVKTATGFGPGGATVHDVALLRQTVGLEMGVKAAGGIRDRETALAMVQAGANRIGSSHSLAIVTAGR